MVKIKCFIKYLNQGISKTFQKVGYSLKNGFIVFFLKPKISYFDPLPQGLQRAD